jgi:V-type H+-transporting ATPase subunit a
MLSANSARQFRIQIEPISFKKMTPPTYFKTNEVTSISQAIVDTYGVPTYKEVNPAYFATVTFPFLFAVMFGDIGHGFLLFLLAAVLCLFGNSLSKSVKSLAPFYKMRYMLLLMGIFSTFSGFLYNDFMGISLNLFGSCYNLNTGQRKDPNCVYPLGIDPVWALSRQDLVFTNSIKMKTAVIIGVTHMLLGLVQKGINARFFKHTLDLVHEFIPQILLMVCLFGYMDFMIITKWLSNY